MGSCCSSTLSPSWRGPHVVTKSLQHHQHLSMSVYPGAFSGRAAQPTEGSQMGQGVHVLSQGPRRPPAGLSPHCPRHEPPIHNPVLASFLSLTCSPVLKLCFLGPPPKETSCTQILAPWSAFLGTPEGDRKARRARVTLLPQPCLELWVLFVRLEPRAGVSLPVTAVFVGMTRTPGLG